MEILKGIGVSPGVGIYTAVVIEAETYRIPRRTVPPEQIRLEKQRLRQAFLDATEEVTHLQSSQSELWDSKIKDFFAVHLHFLRDKSLRRKISDLLAEQNYTAEYAVSVTLRDIAKHFAGAGDAYISERVTDIYDIERRLLRHLIGKRREELQHLTEPVVVVSHDLTPTQTASFDKRFVKGIATDAGGRTSHTAIVSRSLGIPAVVALGNVTALVAAGDLVIVDEYKTFAAAIIEQEHELDELSRLPAVTTDGFPIQLFGNIELPDEADITLQKGGQGIGLYRTEFLYLGSDRDPTEEDHYEAYMTTIRSFGNHPITIRTVDLGADKFLHRDRWVKEPNPFLGLRSIRYCLNHLNLFKTQMRAILRASVHGNLKIMFPLITNILELRQAKWVLADVKEDLEEQKIPFNDSIPVGIMIETPAAAMTADDLADEVDFFSIGTNDLTQYTLAIDRVNERVTYLYDPLHPAVLKLIKMIVEAGHRAGIRVSMCGEMAGEPAYTLVLLGFELDELSMNPLAIPRVKKIIRNATFEESQALLNKAMTFSTAREIEAYVRDYMTSRFPDDFRRED
ncbi:MAG: Phosphoenolpyruvate-protein phosphotransferase [Planctomycetes bacterium ADurb.Bin412]|nr:MAG: Phosphoenolpyruvate-protein phosphotransferase [Planctomycetes bacterium ADurb.Bin412]